MAGDFLTALNTIGRDLRRRAQERANELRNGPTTSFQRREKGVMEEVNSVVKAWNTPGRREEAKRMIAFYRKMADKIGDRGDGHLRKIISRLESQDITDL